MHRGTDRNGLIDVLISVVPMIDYNRKSFIYLQPIIDRLEFWESIIIGKILQEKNFIFI